MAADVHVQNPEPGRPGQQQGAPGSQIMGKMNAAESEFPENSFEVQGDKNIILDDQNSDRISALYHGSPGFGPSGA